MHPLFPSHELPGLPKLTRAWLRGDEAARRFLPAPRPVASGSVALPWDRTRPWAPLLAALLRLNRGLGNPAAEPLVEKLRNGAVAVVAGQQVNLFGGPLLVLYKAFEAIRIARRIESAGTPAVPIFWMAAEDHDLVEVLEARMRTRRGVERYEIGPIAEANRRPVGPLPLGPAPREWLGRIGADLPAPLLAALAPTETFATSFARFLLEVLAPREILFVDPTLPEVKADLADLLARVFRRMPEIQRVLAAREAEIEAAGFDLQVVHRPNQCHVFWIDEGARRPLDVQEAGVAGPRDGEEEERRPLEEWARLAEEKPEELSPAVLLRPLAAARLFPQAVAVVGPSEVAYWAQSAPLFPLFDLPLPDLAPRPHVFLLDPTVRRLLSQLAVPIRDLLDGPEGVLRVLAERDVGGALGRLRGATVTIRHHLVGLEEPLSEIDPTLRGAYQNAAAKITHQINSLLRKGEEAWGRLDSTRNARVERVVDMLRPGGVLQERHDLILDWLLAVPHLGELVWEALESAPDGTAIGIEFGKSRSSDPEDANDV